MKRFVVFAIAAVLCVAGARTVFGLAIDQNGNILGAKPRTGPNLCGPGTCEQKCLQAQTAMGATGFLGNACTQKCILTNAGMSGGAAGGMAGAFMSACMNAGTTDIECAAQLAVYSVCAAGQVLESQTPLNVLDKVCTPPDQGACGAMSLVGGIAPAAR